MINIAIAGGNGALGRTFVEAFRGEEASKRYQTFVLTRRKRNFEDQHELEVMYRNVDSLRKVLEEHEIHTVICTLGTTPRGLSVSQMNLIKAASLSRCTKRFIPSIGRPPGLREHFECLDGLATSGLEWTEVVNGVFLDSNGMPHIGTNLKSVVAVDMATRKASGDGAISFTYARDLARFVVRMVGLEEGKWEREMRVFGNADRWALRRADEVKGKFEVVHGSEEKLKRVEITELPGHRELYEAFTKERLQLFLSTFELWTTDETCLVK